MSTCSLAKGGGGSSIHSLVQTLNNTFISFYKGVSALQVIHTYLNCTMTNFSSMIKNIITGWYIIFVHCSTTSTLSASLRRSTSGPLCLTQCSVSLCISVDVPRSLVLCLLCQSFIWQLHEKHNYTAREAIWHPQLSDWNHRWELWNRWVSHFHFVHVSMYWLGTKVHTFKQLDTKAISQEYVLSMSAGSTL